MRIKKLPKKDGWIAVHASKNEKYKTESAFWYALKKLLQKKGYDVIKRNMEQDGHMMGSKYTYYIRDRKWKYLLYDHMWVIRFINQDFNKDKKVVIQYTVNPN